MFASSSFVSRSLRFSARVGCAVALWAGLLMAAPASGQQPAAASGPQPPAASAQQPPAAPGQKAPAGEKQSDLRNVMQLLAQVDSSEARFTEEKHVPALTRPLMLSGRLSYVRGGRVARTVFAPHEERLVVQGDLLTVESPARGTQTVSLRNYPAAWAFVEGFRATLGGDLPALERFYRPTFSGTVAAWSLELVPREEQMARYVESITFRGSRSTISTIQIAEAGGGRSLMKITPDSP
jgi:hypothetical protein